MKRLIFVFAVFIIAVFLNMSVFADSFSIITENKQAEPGNEAEIKISLENNTGILAARFKMTYDKERLKLIDSTDGKLIAGGVFSPNCDSYPYIMLWNSASSENFTDDGTLVTLKFKVLDTAKNGMAFINLEYDADDIYDVELKSIDLTVENGYIEVINSKNDNSSSDSDGSTDNNNTESSNNSSFGGSSRPSGSIIGNIKNTEINSNEIKLTDKKENDKIILTIGKNDAKVFGKEVYNDVAPVIRNDRTMLPARFVAESLGAMVKWDNETRKVIITKDRTTIIIVIDSQTAYVNNSPIQLDSPAFIENDRTYTPLRFIAENLGAEVEWNEKSREVIITK